MSEAYSDLQLSLSFNEGHNDAWEGKPPKPAPSDRICDQRHQSYRAGHVAGTTARYYYDMGRKSMENECT